MTVADGVAERAELAGARQEVGALHRRLEWVLTEGAYPGLPGRRRRG